MTTPPTINENSPQLRGGRLLATGIGLLGLAGVFVALIVLGVFDPRPPGAEQATAAPGVHSLAGAGEAMIPLDSPVTVEPYTVRLAAAYLDGETDSGYGLVVGDGAGALVVAVSPLGYAAVWQTSNGDQPLYHLPWQTWPHIHTGTSANEITIDIVPELTEAAVSVRINRELLWQSQIAAPAPGNALWLGSYGGPVTVDFRQVVWFADQ